jgi:hypothetical protein
MTNNKRKRRLRAARKAAAIERHYVGELERAHVVPEAIKLATTALRVILKKQKVCPSKQKLVCPRGSHDD